MKRPVVLTTVVVALLSASLQAQAPAKKLIATGWDSPNPQRLRTVLSDVEESPFQGIVVRFTGTGNKPYFTNAFTPDVWDAEALGLLEENLKACTFDRPLKSFLSINANPGDVDWFDDAAWVQIVDHWRTAARLAKVGDMRGILFDPEPYRPPHRQFGYTSQAGAGDHTFAEYTTMARQRGREVMSAVAEEYPDLTLFCYFMLSVNGHDAERNDPSRALAGSGYGLYPAFINGWLDVAPPEMTFVDGCEGAYRFNSESQYLNAANRIKGICQRLVSPENRYKYRAQVQASFGIYLDAHMNPPESPWYVDPGELSRVANLRRNVETALRVADEYVWVYGEKASWWETPHDRANAQRWWDAMPGIADALNSAVDPMSFARRKIADAGDALQSLLLNASFADENVTRPDGSTAQYSDGGYPAGWSFWQDEKKSDGAATWDRDAGAARMSKVENGCFLQSVPAQPGERYAILAKVRRQGFGDASIRIRWQTADTKWHAETLDRTFDAPATGDDWAEIAGVATVPEGAGRLVVLLGARGQRSDEDAVWYDDVMLLKLDEE